MGIYVRGKTLWLRYRDIDGKWRNASSGYTVGDERKAKKALAEIEARVSAARAPTRAATGSMMSLRDFGKKWLENRENATKADDRGRLDNHILPVLGDIPLAELRPRHIRDFVDALKTKRKLGNRRKDGTRVPT